MPARKEGWRQGVRHCWLTGQVPVVGKGYWRRQGAELQGSVVQGRTQEDWISGRVF